MVIEKLKPVNGLNKVKKWIEDRGLNRAAVTNSSRTNAELVISMLGLTGFFEVVIIGDECEHAKPHPEPCLKALEDFVTGIKPGVIAEMPLIDITTRDPEQASAILIKDYEDPKLWAVLDKLDRKGDTVENA
ncbi:haloacid dehalogenase-like hydrolase domain-containing protein Sgpp [Benincasa hispida]|uniref:haloacid dehalogenase-like hydrolase domain-containing protein Sgpp n=1 Tax=Benincasa hispida TaxID=102211 RepID=UPI0019002722|nr:haloacid dehalogenase-like hydrolase domain-containing protein Sgpp [Benincasa hispida]